jgi:hypothetical protein
MKQYNENNPLKVKFLVLDTDKVNARNCVENFVLELRGIYQKLTSKNQNLFNTSTFYSFKRITLDTSMATSITVTTPNFTYKFIIPNKIEVDFEELQKLIFSDKLEAPGGIIYLNLDSEQKNVIEEFRKESPLFAIDFDATNCTPALFLDSIPDFLNQNQTKSESDYYIDQCHSISSI